VLICSLCGYKSTQKKYRHKDINQHFKNAIQIRCPRNICRKQYDHSVPNGYICNIWYDYMGWQTIEIQTIEDCKAIQRAKRIRDIGLQFYLENLE